MAKKVIEDTGEVKTVVHTWRKPREAVALDISKDGVIQHYDFAYDPELRDLKIVEADKEDREAYIQSFAAETGIYNILRKYSKTGDASLLNVSNLSYGDISDLPTDELDPVKAAEAAAEALSGLNSSLGTELTQEQLAAMSSEELNALIQNAVAAAAAKANSGSSSQEEGGKE